MEKMSRVAFSLKIEGKEQRDEVWVFEGFGKAKKGLIFFSFCVEDGDE